MNIRHRGFASRWAVIGMTMLILGGAGWSMRYRLYGQIQQITFLQNPQEPQVHLMTVPALTIEEVQGYDQIYEYTGKVVPRRRSQIGFEISGRLDSLHVDDGDIVYQGQVLGRLEKDRYLNRYAGILAQKQQAEAVLKQLQNGRSEDLTAARSLIRELQAELARIEANLKRQEELLNKKVISREAYEQTYYAHVSNKEKLTQAEQNLLKLERGGREGEKLAQEALVRQLDETLKGINIDLQDCELKAPYSGVIIKRLHDEGEVLQPGIPVFEMIEAGNLEIRVGIPVKAINVLDSAKELEVVHSRGKAIATRKSLVTEIDPRTRTQTMILEIPMEHASQFTAEDIVRVKVREHLKQQGFWLPSTALVEAGKGLWSCYVLKPVANKTQHQQQLYQAEDRLVETLHIEDEKTLVRGTLNSGELVIAEGTLKIVPGQKVYIRK